MQPNANIAIPERAIAAHDYVQHEEKVSLHYGIFCFAAITLATNLAFDYLTSSSSNITSFLEYSSITALAASATALCYDHYEYQQKQQATRKAVEVPVISIDNTEIVPPQFAEAIIAEREQETENLELAQARNI